MTTVSVDPVQQGAYPMKIPSYSYQYPSHRRVQLAAVKEGLFHPRLPSFRRMDMDTAGHKLPDEHCRTTTTCGPGKIINFHFFFIKIKMVRRQFYVLINFYTVYSFCQALND